MVSYVVSRRKRPFTRNSVDDKQLVDRIRSGDRSAQRALYDAHVDRVYRLAYRMSGDETLARDFTQDAFVRAFDRLDGYRGDAAFSTWMHAVTTSVVLNGLRKIKRIRGRELDIEAARGIAHSVPRAEPDLKIRLAAAVNALPEAYRTVFLMHDVEGYTHREIAAALELKIGTSKARLSRARARLRMDLKEFAEEWVA
ncbi:MAG: RNA polymerase sigma factor [Gemmatimonadetes bacterium]|nr:MAG: RNA polymerase sigma factor [Gemmatimonadota bacterium]